MEQILHLFPLAPFGGFGGRGEGSFRNLLQEKQDAAGLRCRVPVRLEIRVIGNPGQGLAFCLLSSDVVVEREFVGMGPCADRLNFIFDLVVNPGFDQLLGEDVSLK